MSDKIKVTYELEGNGEYDDPEDEYYFIDFHNTGDTHVCHPIKPNDTHDFISQIVSAYLHGQAQGVHMATELIRDNIRDVVSGLYSETDIYLSFDLKESE